jgi:hypothetical protein
LLVFEEILYDLEGVACVFSGYLVCVLVFDLGFAVFGLDGDFWVESDE